MGAKHIVTSRMIISAWMMKIAAELDKRFGPHPRVARSKVVEIMKELVDASEARDKEQMKVWLEAQINLTFAGTEFDD